MPKDTKTLGNNKAWAWESPGFVHKKGCARVLTHLYVMMKLIGEGYDLYNCIPVISEFMGHKSLFSTEQYLRFTAEMYPQYISYSHMASEPITDILIKAAEFEDE